MKKKILLLNPPGSRIYLREYYCSKTPKIPFNFYPVDLYYLSGRLWGEHDARVLDCMAEGVGPAEGLRRVEAFDPEIIVALTGHVSWREDVEFFRAVKAGGKRRIVASGDILLSPDSEYAGGDFPIDAALLDFTNDDILHYIKGDYEKLRYMNRWRDGAAAICSTPREKGSEFETPMPVLDAFPYKKYHFPFARRHPFGVVLTDYGCPYSCGFCIVNTVGYKSRTIPNVIEELDMLKQHNIRELVFMDQTFGAAPRRTETLLEEMIRRNYKFGFSCWTRADLITRENTALLRRAGCHTVMMGAESASDETLERQAKGITVDAVERGFRIARGAGLRTLGTFILGLPGEAPEDDLATIKYAVRLNPDFASFNVASPKANTKIREEWLARNLIRHDNDFMDQSGFGPSADEKTPGCGDVSDIRKLAEKAFYPRLSYIVRRLAGVRSVYELRNLVNAASHIALRR